jgi:hypothetical protein
VSVEVPTPFGATATLAGLVDDVRPTGDTAVVRVTDPTNPPRLLRSIVEVPDCPARIVKLDNPVEIEKSTTLTFTWTV